VSDGQRRFSEDAYKWLQNYHGSIDATALLLAYDAGRKDAHKAVKEAIEVLTGPALILDKGSAQSSADKAYRILYKEVYGE